MTPYVKNVMLASADQGNGAAAVHRVTRVVGNPSFALLRSTGIALLTLWRRRRHVTGSAAQLVEGALMNAGVIIQITAAGGAYGAMLREAGLGDAIKGVAQSAGGGSPSLLTGLPVLMLAFVVSSKISI